MKTFTNLVLCIFVLTLISISCKKDAVTKTKKEILTASKWKVSSEKINGVARIFEDCSRDDFMTFAINGTYTSNPGAIKCDPSEAIYTGTWALSSDEKYLIMDGDNATIIALTETRMVLSVVDNTENPPRTMEFTFIPF